MNDEAEKIKVKLLDSHNFSTIVLECCLRDFLLWTIDMLGQIIFALFFLWGCWCHACIIECLIAFLVTTHEMPVASSPLVVQLEMFSDIAIISLEGHNPWLRTTVLGKE